MGSIRKLTAKDVRDAKAGDHHDGGGLYLQVGKGGAKSWLFRFTLHGYTRKMGLGPVDVIGLAEARNKRDEARNKVKNGIDPIEARKQKLQDERGRGSKADHPR